MIERDPEDALFGSLSEYAMKSKDKIWYKALMIVYFDKGFPLDFVVTSAEYYDAINFLSMIGVIKSRNYKSMLPFSKLCVYCVDKLRNTHYIPMKCLDDSVILRFKNTEVFDKTSKKIDPEAKQKKDFLETQGRALRKLVERGEI